jgi:uncharacterized lipoprotein YbaY
MTRIVHAVLPAVAAALATVSTLSSCSSRAADPALPPLKVEAASIPEMQEAMQQGRITSREIVTQYLTRIGLYEARSSLPSRR